MSTTLAATPFGYLLHGSYPIVDLSPQHLVSEPTTMAFAAEKMLRQILRVTIQHVLYPITESVLHQVFDPYGAVEAIEIFPAKSRIVVFIVYGSHHELFRSLQGRNIYDGCCQLGIELLPVSPSLDATKLKVMTQQAVTKVDAPQQEQRQRKHVQVQQKQAQLEEQ
jgi:hypothetical protein